MKKLKQEHCDLVRDKLNSVVNNKHFILAIEENIDDKYYSPPTNLLDEFFSKEFKPLPSFLGTDEYIIRCHLMLIVYNYRYYCLRNKRKKHFTSYHNDINSIVFSQLFARDRPFIIENVKMRAVTEYAPGGTKIDIDIKDGEGCK